MLGSLLGTLRFPRRRFLGLRFSSMYRIQNLDVLSLFGLVIGTSKPMAREVSKHPNHCPVHSITEKANIAIAWNPRWCAPTSMLAQEPHSQVDRGEDDFRVSFAETKHGEAKKHTKKSPLPFKVISCLVDIGADTFPRTFPNLCIL